ncbi:MAG: hypothetical protein H6Q36_1241 [Chloroflexi bacterium]|nr:hypothetical protein [Chloroflexota bacterium]
MRLDQPADAAAAVNQLADRFWDAVLQQLPSVATMYGDERWDDRLEDPGPVGRAAARALREATLAELAAIPVDLLPAEERITADMLGLACRLGIAQDDARFDLVAGSVDQIDGPQARLPQVLQFQRADTPERLDRLVARIEAFPVFTDAHLGLLADGLRTGITAPRVVAERTIDQVERMLALPPERHPVAVIPRLADEAGRARLVRAVEQIVNPALGRYLAALRGDYLAATRPVPGLCSAPGGDELYRLAIRSWTSLDLDPAEVHRVGLEDLEAIAVEQRALAGAAGFGDDVAAYRAALGADPAQQSATKEELAERALALIERAMAQAPRWFGRLPRAGCEVRPEEPALEREAPPARYAPPAVDGSRPGIYFVNTYDLPTRVAWRLAAMTFHEAVPGHHFQIALEMEQEALPTFRRLGSRMLGSAYVEGWALYTERLADEMGLYRSPAERLGMLDAQAWRAARLVVDSGVHAFGRSREWAAGLLRDTGLSDTDAGIETDRYIVWPGQALTYRTGQREIERLRAQLAARDGAAFDLRAFHDAVLAHGSVPLATLARELPGWVRPASA